MNGPGVSLFQGPEFRLNQTDPDDEEAENAEEEKRRNADLKNLLNGAFDDLQINDCDLSIASSKNLIDQSMPVGAMSSDEEPQREQTTPKKLTNGHHLNGFITNGNGDSGDNQLSSHYKHCYHNKGAYADSSAASSPAKITNGGDVEQLASLYNVRMREISRLQDVLETTKTEAAERVERLGQKILQLEAEKVAMKSSYTQTQALLVAGKEQISELLKQVEELKFKNQGLDELREELEQDGVILRANVESLNSKLIALEKISIETSGSKQADQIVRSLQERHTREIASFQLQMKELQDKLSKSMDNAKFNERRIAEMTRNHEMDMLERVDTINRLSRALAESQQHCQELMASTNTGATAEIHKLRSQVKLLEGEAQQYKIDIDHLETMVGLSILTSNSAMTDSEKPRFYKTGLDTIEGLKDELAKSLRHHESRRAEIKQLKYALHEAKLALEEADKNKEDNAVLKAQCEKLQNELKAAHLNMDSTNINQLGQENKDLKEKISTLEEAIVRLQQQNTDIAEHSVELQRMYDEEKLKVIDDHSQEFLKFHSDALARTRQEERDKVVKEMRKLKCQLDLALKDADDSKQAYINLVATKNTIASELDSQRKIMDKLQNQIGSNAKHDFGEMHVSLYEERVRREIENAKREMIEEVVKEKEILKREAKLEAEKEFEKKIDEAVHTAKLEWHKAMTQSANLPPLEAQIEKLKLQIEEEREEAKNNLKKVEEKLWSHFHEELMRMERQNIELRSGDDPDGRKHDGNISMRKTHSLSNLETRPDLQEQIQKLSHELETAKKTYSSRLMEMQEHLFLKQKEMEEFKQKLVGYTNNQFEAKDKQNERFVEALKKEIECLNEELSKKTELESKSDEVKKLKSEKRRMEEDRARLKRLLEKYKEKISLAKDYYEKREKVIADQFKQKEDEYYKILLKLKHEVDSITLLDFAEDEGDRPVRL